MIMTYPVTSGTDLVEIGDYNIIYQNIIDVIDTNESGWGLSMYNSTPVTSNQRVRAVDWRNILRDLIQTAYYHITNTTTVLTSAVKFPTTSSFITADFHNQLYNTSTYVLANRYVCAEEQYAPLNTTDGISTRTTVWGITENYIQHQVRVRWANRLTALYFFNTGGYLTWTPSHSNNGQNDLDSEWAAFILGIVNDQAVNELRYTRSDFVSQTPGTTATIYPAGSSGPGFTYESISGYLSVNVEVFKANNEEYVDFIVTFKNSDSSELLISPAVGYWNYTI